MKTRLFFVVALLLGVSLACNTFTGGKEAPAAPTAVPQESQGSQSAPQGSEGSSAPTAAPAQPTSAPAEPTSAPEEPVQPPAAASGEVTDITTFAKSYKLRFYVTWQPESGDPEATDVLVEHVSEPLAEHVVITSPDGDLEITQIGSESWMCFDGDCIYSQDELEDFEPFLDEGDDTSAFFNDPDVALKKVGTETINGFKATHYTVTLPPDAVQDMAEGEASNPQSEVWIVEDGKYPRFVVRWTASWDETRDGVNGRGSLEYEVMALDTDLSITPPENASSNNGGGEDNAQGGGDASLPTYPGAQVVASMTGYSMMNTSDDAQTVAEYYNTVLADEGWTQQTNDNLGGMVIQTWEKEDQTLTVTIMPNDEGTTEIMLIIE